MTLLISKEIKWIIFILKPFLFPVICFLNMEVRRFKTKIYNNLFSGLWEAKSSDQQRTFWKVFILEDHI